MRKVFELVAADEMLINKRVPDFERIITALSDAINIISKNSDPIINPLPKDDCELDLLIK